MTEVAVVGAGLGGLAAAIELARAGHRVRVFEAADGPGGKAGVVELDGIELDTGPSLLTLPRVFDALFRRAGTSLAKEFSLERLAPSFRYLWPDGARLDVGPSLEDTLEAVREAFGREAARELRAFLAHAGKIWEAAAPHFVEGPAPTLGSLASTTALGAIARIDPLRSMASAIAAEVHEPHVADVLTRFATYNGSDPRRAPATLLCIAHVELVEGAFGVRGGIHALIRALVRVAERLGVRFHYEARVVQIELEGARARGVRLEGGERIRADAVVANADVAHLCRDLLPEGRGPRSGGPPSTSGWNALVRARRVDGRAPHTVLFPEHYHDEWRDLFDRDQPPSDPSVYLCAPARAHARGSWPGAEPLFLMVNAPAEPEHGARDPEVWSALRERVWAKLRAAELVDVDDEILWSRSPTDLAARFPGSRGALYGASSSSSLAAFLRPNNRVLRVPGLYLASGSAHPGGGMPLCVLSGRAAARALLQDLAPSRARRALERVGLARPRSA